MRAQLAFDRAVPLRTIIRVARAFVVVVVVVSCTLPVIVVSRRSFALSPPRRAVRPRTSPRRTAPRKGPRRSSRGGARLRWSACDQTFECATLAVPLAYDEPNGTRIKIALERLRALSPSLRAGSLVVNPGGPGGSGNAFVRNAAQAILSPVARERFDIVGFDPRGVGRSTPLPCGSAQGRSATTGLDYVRALHDACVDRAAALTASITTANTARDMEQIRIALGDERLTDLGVSYGTYLGLVYGDGSDVAAIVRSFDNRLPDPPDFEDVVASDAAYLQIACSEGFHPSASADVATLAAKVAGVAPAFVRTAEALAQPTCEAWGTRVDTRPQPVARRVFRR